MGLTHCCYRFGTEPSIRSLLDAVCVSTGRRGEKIAPPDRAEGSQQAPDLVFDLDSSDVPAAEEPPPENEKATDPHETIVAVPEHSHPGESASNGKAESAVKSVVAMARTLKLALESRLGIKTPLPCAHPIVGWIFQHATWILNKYGLNSEGRTPWGLLHGREARERVAEFGEKIMYDLQKQTRAKLDARWRYGAFLGRALSSD